MVNGRQYSAGHGEPAINFNTTSNQCRLCRCSNGRFMFCTEVDCPYVRDTGTRPCNVSGRMVPHRETYGDDCNTCRCINGYVRCTRRDCSDDEDDDKDNLDNDEPFAVCHRMARSPMCGPNLRTYPNDCAARAAGFEGIELVPGACSRDVSNDNMQDCFSLWL